MKTTVKILAPVSFAAAGAVAALMATASMAHDDRGRGRDLAPDQCIATPLNNTRIVDSRTLYVDDRMGHAALLHMGSECLNSFHEAIGVKFQGTSRICGPMDVDITDSIFTMPTTCMIDSIEALNKDEAKVYRNGK